MTLQVQQIYINDSNAPDGITIVLNAIHSWYGSLTKKVTINEAKNFYVGQILEINDPQV